MSERALQANTLSVLVGRPLDSHGSIGEGAIDFPREGYQSWGQVGGYFDGDGNVGVEVVKYVLRFKLIFSDTRKPKIEAVESFMQANGIRVTNTQHEVREGKPVAFRFDVNALRSVLEAAEAMLPVCIRKAEDLAILADYIEGRITGNQAVERYNAEVRIGRRSGYIRALALPLTRAEGLRQAQLENASNARAAYSVDVAQGIQERIRHDHLELELGYIRLSKKYGYPVGVIRRICGRPSYFTSKGIRFPLWS